MRYAIFSDIHGNYNALDAVLKDIDSKENIDKKVCLGDIVGYKGKQPVKCLTTILKETDICVMGNHDAALLNRDLLSYFNPDAREPIEKLNKIISKENKNKIKELPYVVVDENAIFSHGTLYKPKHFYYSFNTDLETLSVIMKDYDRFVSFNGHSHQNEIIEIDEKQISLFNKIRIDRMRRVKLLRKKAKTIVNVGSVGLPRDGDQRASYVIYDTVKNTVKFCRVDYEPEKEMTDSTINLIKKSPFKRIKKTFGF